MDAILTKTETSIIFEQSMILNGISWQSYEQLMKDHEDRSLPRFTYSQGNLEVFMPSEKHERLIRAMDSIVSLYIEENDLDAEVLGSTTFKNESFDKGVEPDCSFYIQNIEKVKNVKKINLQIHPPPDLVVEVVEVDITSPSINRFPIYAEFGVPEIWQYKQGQVKIFTLFAGEYLEAEESLALPKITGAILTKFLNESEIGKRSTWLKNVRRWINENC